MVVVVAAAGVAAVVVVVVVAAAVVGGGGGGGVLCVGPGPPLGRFFSVHVRVFQSDTAVEKQQC